MGSELSRPALEREIANALRAYIAEEGPIIRSEADEAAAAVAPAVVAFSGLGEAWIRRVVAAAIRSSFDAHGPVTREHAASAAMRAVTQLRADGVWRAPEPRPN